jgi:hypothetical protein
VEVLLVSVWQQMQRERQARFWELIREGWTNTAACEAVRVERRQGYRWRKAAGGRIPGPPRPTSGRYLSLAERLAIARVRPVANRPPATPPQQEVPLLQPTIWLEAAASLGGVG